MQTILSLLLIILNNIENYAIYKLIMDIDLTLYWFFIIYNNRILTILDTMGSNIFQYLLKYNTSNEIPILAKNWIFEIIYREMLLLQKYLHYYYGNIYTETPVMRKFWIYIENIGNDKVKYFLLILEKYCQNINCEILAQYFMTIFPILIKK